MCNYRDKILIVDDDHTQRRLLRIAIERATDDPVILEATSAAEAREIITREADLSLIIMDRTLPDGDGLDVLLDTRRKGNQETRALIVSAMEQPRKSPFKYISKPYGPTTLAAEINIRLQKWRTLKTTQDALSVVSGALTTIGNMSHAHG